ncbi:hexamerin 70c [Augochlora pura]
MLKIALLLALGAFCAVQASGSDSRTANVEFLQKQKKIFEILLYVSQNDLNDAEYYNIGRSYNVESNIDMYNNKDAVKQFIWWYKQGSLLDKNALFSVYNPENAYEMKQLFEMFYSAKDFQTFYKTACWARINVNDGVFVAAFTSAVFYRNDCKYMRLPAMYEIYPNMYNNLFVIQQAQNFKMSKGCGANFGLDNNDSFMIYTNYSSAYIPYDESEYKMDYFMEDPSMNAFYYYFRQVLPFWLSSDYVGMSKELRGNLYYYYHQQLMAKYYLERFSNGLGDVDDLNWYKPIQPGFFSQMLYSNGVPMPYRNQYSAIPFYKNKYLNAITGFEYRIMEAIDSGFLQDEQGNKVNIYSPQGLYLLANVIEGNYDSCNKKFYGMYDAYARDILGFSYDYQNRNKMIPSALQCHSTSMRDPSFYMLYKKIMNYFFRYKKNLPMYKQSELQFQGVKIESVDIDRLNTYFDYCDTVINNAISVENFNHGKSLKMKARRPCLNYQPFSYKFNINSDKEETALVKIFLGPYFEGESQDYYYLQKYYKYFFEMDRFTVKLSAGANNLVRKSSDSMLTMPDMMPMDQFMEKLNRAISGNEPFKYSERQFGFSSRFTLPKGSPKGIKYKMFFFVSPYQENKQSYYELPYFGKFFYDGKAPGFPLDRPLYAWNYTIPNMFFKNVMIYNTSKYLSFIVFYTNMLRLWLLSLFAVSFIGAGWGHELFQANQEYLSNQAKIYQLLFRVTHPEIANTRLHEQSEKANPLFCYPNCHQFKDPNVVWTFEKLRVRGTLPRNVIFSIYQDSHLAQLKALTELFLSADSFDTFYHTAEWASVNENEGLFVFAVYTAVIHRPDTKYLRLPPLYELYPYAFYSADVIKAINDHKISYLFSRTRPETEPFVVNYTDKNVNNQNNLEDKLNYFVNDIGLNAYYVFLRLNNPFWLNSTLLDSSGYRGEEFLYGHSQLLKRYNLERVANELPFVENFLWTEPFPVGYEPSLTFHNGLPWPQRQPYSKLSKTSYKDIIDIVDIEARIRTAIDSGFALNEQNKWVNVYNLTHGLNTLGNLIEGNVDSINKNVYGSIDKLSRKILGRGKIPVTDTTVIPSALETFTGCLRDPAFYRILVKINDLYERYKLRQNGYSKGETLTPFKYEDKHHKKVEAAQHLTLKSVNVTELITFFDVYESSVIINNPLFKTVKIAQNRLNHNNFKFSIKVSSEVQTKAVVKIFLGPKTDVYNNPIELPRDYNYFYEIDNWLVALQRGNNYIEHYSNDSSFYYPDFEPSDVYYRKVLSTDTPLYLEKRIAGFPQRLLLPKGDVAGKQYQLFVYINPINEEDEVTYHSRVFGSTLFDKYSLGFPLDKLLSGWTQKQQQNWILQDVTIYHCGETPLDKHHPNCQLPHYKRHLISSDTY